MLNIENPGTDYENWYNPLESVWCNWHDEMLSILDMTVAKLTTDPNNYAYFIAPGEVHTILMNNEVYTLTVNDVRFVDWLRSIVEGGVTFANVVCSDCQQPENIVCQ
jgi:hypothetical protein